MSSVLSLFVLLQRGSMIAMWTSVIRTEVSAPVMTQRRKARIGLGVTLNRVTLNGTLFTGIALKLEFEFMRI